MAIYNTNGTAAKIGAVRYVENGKIVNISKVLGVENGVTVLLYGGKPTWKPSGDYIYLYKEGVTSDLVGGWEGSSKDTNRIIFSEQENYLSLFVKKGVPTGDYTIAPVESVNMIDVSNYQKICFAYEWIGIPTDWNTYMWRLEDSEGYWGRQYGISTISNYTEIDLSELTNKKGYFIFDLADTGIAVSSTEDVELRIYAIWLERTSA